VKLAVDTVRTVPDAPPDDGPDRAFDPAPPDPRPPGDPPAAVAEGDVAVAKAVPQAAESPITAHMRTPMIHRLLLFDRRAPGVALETARPGTVSCGLVGS
jgi:hypothetical protein